MHLLWPLLRAFLTVVDVVRSPTCDTSINLRGSALDERKIFSQALTLSQNAFFKEKGNWCMMYGDGDL
jgi:hypothetical protein